MTSGKKFRVNNSFHVEEWNQHENSITSERSYMHLMHFCSCCVQFEPTAFLHMHKCNYFAHTLRVLAKGNSMNTCIMVLSHVPPASFPIPAHPVVVTSFTKLFDHALNHICQWNSLYHTVSCCGDFIHQHFWSSLVAYLPMKFCFPCYLYLFSKVWRCLHWILRIKNELENTPIVVCIWIF